MRINLSFANAYLIKTLTKAGGIASIKFDAGDLVLVELPSGENVMIHLVERDIDLAEIANLLHQDAKEGYFTLFILWANMLLPEDGQLYPPYDWMSALLSLYGGKIYGYEADGQHADIYPVYFEPQPSGLEQRVTYGVSSTMRRIICQTVHISDQAMNGEWRIAEFDDAPPKGAPGHAAGSKADNHSQSNASGKSNQNQSRTTGRHSMQDYYDILGLDRSADADAVRHAFRQLALRFHPDVNNSPEAHEYMQELNVAYAKIMAQFD
ncbi:MAG TPA: J domain-containing protein [Aggregatilineales bacterium]|nr:J domain-containing protein [Aggregatilineales bacterium]